MVDEGLYNQKEAHENCGLAFVATLKGVAQRSIVEQGLEALVNLDHRGAVGAEENSGDGAGILVSTPDEFLHAKFAEVGVTLPTLGQYACGIAFLSQDESERFSQIHTFESILESEGLYSLGSREVGVDTSMIGPTALRAMPYFLQFAIASKDGLEGLELDRKAYRARKLTQKASGLYFASLSARTITYKGMLTTMQLGGFFLDLSDPLFKAKIALVHSRFSTNTFPSWELAQPLRNIAHNGEINTVRGNRNWLGARQGLLKSALISKGEDGDISDLLPILTEGFSDSGSFDECFELLHLTGRSLPHAALMMIPEAHENWDLSALNEDEQLERARLKAFYEYNSTLIEPWDGPASLSFTDGDIIGSILDRNGLRPGRFWVTEDLVVMASEAGVLSGIETSKIVRKGRLEPGKMLLVDTKAGRIIENDEIKRDLANMNDYKAWLSGNSITLEELPHREHIMHPAASVHRRQRAFGYTEEELKLILTPMANTGGEPLGAMGTDTPIAVLSKRARLLFDYFTQDFAQVTNPPLDSIREKVVTSIASAIGPEPNLLEDSQEHAKKLLIPFPVIDNDQLAKIANIEKDTKTSGLKGVTIKGLFPAGEAQVEGAMEKRLEEIFEEVDDAISRGCNFIILSDRNADQEFAPIPSLLLTAAVQHHLLRNESRTKISMIVEAGDVRETHHVALLVGYGAAAVNPYLAMETVERLAYEGYLQVNASQATDNLIKALGKGVLKIMSKMGISTIMSYRGSQIFGAVGLSKELIDKYFTGTTSKIGGVGLKELTEEVLERHSTAYPKAWTAHPHRKLRTGGEYKWRRTGEEHLFDPESIFYLQQATKHGDYTQFKQYSARIDDNSKRLMTIRSLFEMKDAFDLGLTPLNIDEVESVQSIVQRFSTGAMSYGSISIEAHETLAKAMNQLGARSNSGEGGENLDRIYDESRRSKIKQVASGRFGVTSEYLVSADDLQIKLAQGAKPGEGGHLPGTKVYPWVASTRHSTPGIDLVSPPPHHDIYSIEDLAQLIHDLKMANPASRVHVKLVSEYGVGTIAAGVSKCHADVVLISGYDGGTGAAPLSSIKHAGQPWEIGLAEAQQVLVENDLRDRISVQVDGQLKTGRDVVIAALLGAEEFGFATAPLVVEGCVMMRVCNKNTCPVGIATQDPYLRENFNGKVEHVVNFFNFIAEEVREYLAKLGFRTLEEAIGHVEALSQAKIDDPAVAYHYKAQGVDLSALLAKPVNKLRENAPLVKAKEQKHALEKSLDAKLMEQIDFDALGAQNQSVYATIRNVDRTFATMISFEVTKRYNSNTRRYLQDNALYIELTGVAGQSLGAFIPKGVTIRLKGEANDYVAKGLSGGKIIVHPEDNITFDAHTNVIAGNVLGFGATSGAAYFAGVVGERFAVRNSGALLIAEGTGDHALEYMTGGEVVILGPTGKNLGAGFLGGTAYVLDLDYAALNSEASTGNLLDIKSLNALEASVGEHVHSLIFDYFNATKSPFAGDLLNDWESALSRISRIVPLKFLKISALTDIENNWDQVLEIASS
jgi:glutamate synthase (NADPH/NADH) large chain